MGTGEFAAKLPALFGKRLCKHINTTIPLSHWSSLVTLWSPSGKMSSKVFKSYAAWLMLKKKEPVDPQDDDISWSLVFDTVNL
jgi:hypothetical protein